MRAPPIEAGYRTDARGGQFSRKFCQIIRRHPHVGIGHHDTIVACAREHIDQVRDFTIGAPASGVHHDINLMIRMGLLQPLDKCQRRIIGRLKAEDDLKIRMILTQKGQKIFFQSRLRPIERL